MDKKHIEEILSRILDGGKITPEEAYLMAGTPDREALYSAAERLTLAMVPRRFDSCSIVNVKSGMCPEDCKWCAQSGHSKTGIDTYPLLPREETLKAARAAADNGIGRFSMVASGRAVKGRPLQQMCEAYRQISEECDINLCASMGLLGHEELKALRDAGVTRYHCNLETAPSYFSHLCTTHTIEDKIATLQAALDAGMEVCSGGIIGMGETMAQRVELALELLAVNPSSIPVNILCPIPGTPLENAAPLTDDEVLTTLAMFRFIHPRVQLRFAGGRASLSPGVQVRAMRIAVNGGIVGDLLTTVGSTVEEDNKRVREAGYEF